MMEKTSYIIILRPLQWLKNLMLFFPPFLGGSLFHAGTAGKGIIPFISFCLASSSVYIVNDLLDAENDARHPIKKFRPIPAGTVSVKSAWLLSSVLFTAAMLGSTLVSVKFVLLLLTYIIVVICYSLKLKELPIVDIFSISAGFIIRLQAGGEVFGVIISEWLYLSVFLLSLFLSTGKRLCEKKTLGDSAGEHRRILLEYPEGFLEGTMYMTASAVLVTYTMYTINRFQLVYTVPLCTFGLLRYIFRVKAGQSGDPTESLLKDVPLLVISCLWAIWIGWSIYW